MGDLNLLPNNPKPCIKAVIFDLDGTLLDTEQHTKNILTKFLARYGKQPDMEKEKRIMGMTQKESVIATIQAYDLPLTPDQYVQEILPFYQGIIIEDDAKLGENPITRKLIYLPKQRSFWNYLSFYVDPAHVRWLKAKPLPGANRLMQHLYQCGVPFALASNSLRKNIEVKLSHQQGWKEHFSVILGSDDVKAGKPAPDMFLEAAYKMGIDAVNCLVIEDSVVGVKAGKAAGMNVVAVPSVQIECNQYSIADSVLHLLLAFRPELWGLTPFGDWVCNALPVQPIYFRAVYRGGLLHEFSDDRSSLVDQVTGVYFGWGKTDGGTTVKMVISCGWEHDGCSSRKKAEACIVGGNSEHLDDKELQLLINGYIRGPNYMGNTFENLQILDEDKVVASAALDMSEYCPRDDF